jgi:hypothetical protein
MTPNGCSIVIGFWKADMTIRTQPKLSKRALAATMTMDFILRSIFGWCLDSATVRF